MKRSYLHIILLAGVLLFSACEENPFLTKEEAEKQVEQINTGNDPFHAIQNVVAIINNDIYYFNTLDAEPRQLTDTPGSVKTDVKLSFDKTRIAYLNASGNPVIIRADNGEHIETLTQYEYVRQMDWAKDQLTLYMLIDDEVVFHGTPLEVIQPYTVHPWDDVSSFSMNSIGDQGYFIAHYDDAFPRMLNLYSEAAGIDEEYPNFGGDWYDYIDFYDNEGSFLLGYKDDYDYSMDRVICVQDYATFPAYEWDYEAMSTPQFNGEHEMLIYGTMEDPGSHIIKVVYLGYKYYEAHGIYDRLTKLLEAYPSTTPIFIDWVQ